MTKTHFARFKNFENPGATAAAYVRTAAVCHRSAKPGRLTRDARRVTCLDCKKDVRWHAAWIDQRKAVEAAFEATEPREFSEPWRTGTITCNACGSTRFRAQGRSCYGHYEDYQCADCRKVTSRLTETGMSA